jgi:hypothetical protein
MIGLAFFKLLKKFKFPSRNYSSFSVLSIFEKRYFPHFVCLSVGVLTTIHSGLADLARLWFNRLLIASGSEPRKEFFWASPGPCEGV